jgi:hypothetical protein
MKNNIDREQSREIIAFSIIAHLSSHPEDTSYFIGATTKGIQQYASNQQDNAGKFLNFLTDVLIKNPDIKDGDLYSVGDIVKTILPNWQGAGAERILKTLYADRLETAKVFVSGLERIKNEENGYSCEPTVYPSPKKE